MYNPKRFGFSDKKIVATAAIIAKKIRFNNRSGRIMSFIHIGRDRLLAEPVIVHLQRNRKAAYLLKNRRLLRHERDDPGDRVSL